MKPTLRLLAVLASLALSASASLALEAVWPLPTPPPGANPALFPVERQDWLARVQANFDGSKGKTVDLLFDGDSITDNWQRPGKEVWTARYGALHPFDFGISADRIEHLLWRLQQGQVDGLHPKLVVLMIGTNNTGRDSADQIAEGIKAVVADYEKRCPEAHILLLGVFPRSPQAADPIRAKIIEINKQISVLGDGKRVTYLDIGPKFLEPDGTLLPTIMPDYLHPNAKGYEIWADAIQPVVDQYVGKAPAAAAAP